MVLQNIAPTTRLQVMVLGDGNPMSSAGEPKRCLRPVIERNISGVVSVATGRMHAVALTADNRVLTSGVNDRCALGKNITCAALQAEMTTHLRDANDDAPLGLLESTPTVVPVHASANT